MPIVLCVLRHGDAGDAIADPARDARRPLSPRGRRQAKRMGKALAALGLLPHDAWTSRLARAAETAERALDAAESGAPLHATDALAPDADPARLLAGLADAPAPPREGGGAPARGLVARDAVVRWVVGHDPLVSRLVARLVGAPPHAVALGKGCAAVVDLGREGPSGGRGRLVALLPAAAAKSLRHRR